MGGSEDASQEDGGGDGSEDEPPSGIRRKTGHGTTGKPGKRLTLEDLQSHFGVSLQACSRPPPSSCFSPPTKGTPLRVWQAMLRLLKLEPHHGVRDH